jgi:hypothetical protein
MRFLDRGCYFGIEPNEQMLQVGLEQIVEPDVVARAQAHFAANDDFDLSVFGERFDFVVARSIWTHASQAQIAAMLASFARSATPGAVLLSSYHPSSPVAALGRRWPGAERLISELAPMGALSPALARLPALGAARAYRGQGWVGRSHRSDQPGVVQHSLRWIAAEASRYGLQTQLTNHALINRQHWLKISAPR